MNKITASVKNIQIRWIAIVLLISVTAILAFLFLSKPKTVTIPVEKTTETTHWKLYENTDLHFSFKYPEGLLSNFNVTSNSDAYNTMVESSKDKDKNLELEKNENAYNVVFEAKAYKFEGSIKEFLKKGSLPETKDITQQPLISSTTSGVKVTNQNEEDQRAYFEYYLLKNGNYIYNFSLLTDDPILLSANEALLEKIIATLKFLP